MGASRSRLCDNTAFHEQIFKDVVGYATISVGQVSTIGLTLGVTPSLSLREDGTFEDFVFKIRVFGDLRVWESSKLIAYKNLKEDSGAIEFNSGTLGDKLEVKRRTLLDLVEPLKTKVVVAIRGAFFRYYDDRKATDRLRVYYDEQKVNPLACVEVQVDYFLMKSPESYNVSICLSSIHGIAAATREPQTFSSADLRGEGLSTVQDIHLKGVIVSPDRLLKESQRIITSGIQEVRLVKTFL